VVTTIYTKEKMFPIIDAMEARLQEEVPARAQFSNANPAQAVARFKSDLESLRNQVVRRQKFLLDELNKLKR
jgi:hypothetical protein